jgi:anti-anti-sigma regulatory factor
MLDIDMARRRRFALVRASGSIVADSEVDTISGAIDFVPADDDLVVDLSELDALSPGCARTLRRLADSRVRWSGLVVVAANPEVVAQLRSCGIDRIVPIVGTIVEATRELARSAERAVRVGA